MMCTENIGLKDETQFAIEKFDCKYTKLHSPIFNYIYHQFSLF